MNPILLATAKSKTTMRGEAIRFRWAAASACFAASVVFATVAAASTPLLSWIDGSAEPAAAVSAQPATQSDAALPAVPEGQTHRRNRSSCDACGVVESVRRLEQAGNLPASYEFIVRLRDGSRRTSSVASAAGWRAGDRILLIGGAAPSGS